VKTGDTPVYRYKPGPPSARASIFMDGGLAEATCKTSRPLKLGSFEVRPLWLWYTLQCTLKCRFLKLERVSTSYTIT
jgi:hypothetical protein